MAGVPSGNVITPNTPIGPAVDLCGFGTNQSLSSPCKGVLTTPMLEQQGCLGKNVVECPKLQNTFKDLNSASLDKTSQTVVPFKALGGDFMNDKVGSTQRGR